jgi:multidrug resistance efflux pump
MPVWRAIGSLGVVVKARNLPKTLAVVGVLILALIGMFLVPTNLMLSADGTLEPMVKQNVFVNVPGTVVEVLVEDQQLVEEGEPLVVLYNAELSVELQRARGERLVTSQRLASVRDALNRRGLSEDERTKLAGQVMELQESLQSLQNQITLREQQMAELTLRSPITGQVMLSWDVERSLLRRRAEAGQILMAIADPKDEWELELYMPERRMGHVNRAQESIRPDLEVDYILATEPRRRLHGNVRYIDPVSRVHEDAGHSVLIRVDIDEQELGSELRPGAKVHARVNSGRCSYGYRWFHEAIAWVQTKLLF